MKDRVFFYDMFKKLQFKSAPQLTLYSFLIVILLGSLLLFLSERSHNLRYIDALFTATSSVCVTGLLTIDFSRFSFLSQLITLMLIQIGGISVIVFFRLIWFGKTPSSLFSHSMLSEIVDIHGESKTVLYFLVSTIKITVFIEGLGALLLYFSFSEIANLTDRIWTSIFLSVSAFNNAGISVFPDNLTRFTYNQNSLLIMSGLIVLGGIGYPVIIGLERLFVRIIDRIAYYLIARIETLIMRKPDLVDYFQFIYNLTDKFQKEMAETTEEIRGHASNVQLKIVVYGTIFLLLAGTFVFYLLETQFGNSLNGLPSKLQLLHSFFMSVTSRTAGFNYLDITTLTEPTFLFITVLMFIGAAPQGTAGGIKVTTFALMVSYMISSFRGENRVMLLGQMISRSSIANAIKLYLLSTTFIIVASFALLLDVNNKEFIKVLFEVASAFGTVGLSSGITNILNDYGKSILILSMYFGRVNLLNFGAAIFPTTQNASKIKDDGEKLQIG